MSKSKRTQQRYHKSWKGQTSLDSFRFQQKAHPVAPEVLSTSSSDALVHCELAEPEPPKPSSPSTILPCTRSVSTQMMSDPDSDLIDGSESDDSDRVTTNNGANAAEDMDENDAEEWEQELDSTLTSNSEIRDWRTLRDQIQRDLHAGEKILPLSRINQLLILSNFATLRLKGASRIGASLEIARQWHV